VRRRGGIEDIAGSNGSQVMRLSGPLLISNLFDFQNRVLTNTSERLILDFSNVPYVDSAGIGALVGAHVTHNKQGRSLALVGVNSRVRAVLGVTHVEHFFIFLRTCRRPKRHRCNSS
jgi:anti-sigma B factor antagonist